MDIRKFLYEKRSKTAVFDLKLLIFTLIFDIAKPESRLFSLPQIKSILNYIQITAIKVYY